MKGKTCRISIDEIINYYENPRHAIAVDEKDTLKKLFESVGNQYMLNLAEDIKNNGLLGNQQLVVVYKDKINKYVVYEGNRRLAAIKLLTNPFYFDFLDNATQNKANKMSKEMGNPIREVLCYVTDEEEAFFIMERLHSGEDKGRGVKSWSAREKDIFKVRRSDKKTLPYLIDYYVKKYCDDFDITSVMPFTTIQRIFGNKKIKSEIGLDINDESTFTEPRMRLIVNVSKDIAENVKKEGLSMTRLYNLASEIETKVQPLIELYKTSGLLNEKDTASNNEWKENNHSIHKIEEKGEMKENTSIGEEHTQRGSLGSKKNLPYFFLGIDYSHLNPEDADTHGITVVCKELKYLSEKQLVGDLPIAAVFLTRSVIEQSIIYYSKKHCVQGQDKLIWENIKNLTKLSKIIDNYNKNLPNYITDSEMRQYFKALFDEYDKTVDQFNWVVHRTADYQLDTKTIVELPQRGLLTLINYLIAE